MPTQIQLFPQQIADLTAIRALGPDRLARVVLHLDNLAPLPLRPNALHQEITQALDDDESAATHLLRPLLGLYQLVRQRELTVDEVLEGIRYGIVASDPDWEEEDFEAWEAVEPQLRELFQASAVRSVSKAIDLAYEYANLFQGARIVTDVRPIFNDDSEDELRIDGGVISFTLRLHFDNREGDHSLSIALDEVDVRKLQYECERALKKARHAKIQMQFPTVISGESADE
jgi:hypothetical protein